MKRENWQGASAARKADEARLYALRGCLTTQAAYPDDFTSNEVFRDALYIDIIANGSEIPEELIKSINSHFTSVSTDNVISESGESFFSPSLIGVLIKQMSGSIEVGHGVAGEPVFRLIIPQLEIRE